MSAQIVSLFPGGHPRRRSEEERVAELEANVSIAREAAMRAWMAARGVPAWREVHEAIWSGEPGAESVARRRDAEARAFAAWWDGAPAG